MSLISCLLDKYKTDQYAILYSSWIANIVTGKLSDNACSELLNQEIGFVSLIKKMDRKLSASFQACDKSIYRDISISLCADLFLVETVHCPKVNKALKEYYAYLLTKCSQEDYLGILVSIYVCSCLFTFVHEELKSLFPNQHDLILCNPISNLSQISHYLHDKIEFISLFIKKQDLDYVFQETLRLLFEFFIQQDSVPSLPSIDAWKVISVGHLFRTNWEQSPEYHQRLHDCYNHQELTLDILISTLSKDETENMSEEEKQFMKLCREMGKTVIILSESTECITEMSVGLGTMTQLRQLLRHNIPILVCPSEDELSLLRQCNIATHRLLCVFHKSAVILPKRTVFYVNDIIEIGMTVIGERYYTRQQIPFIPTILAISGSDSCGGAGQQADLKTATSLGVFACSCITAVTVQNSQGVKHIEMISKDTILGQLHAVVDDVRVDAIKIGMTGNRDIIVAIADIIRKYNLHNIVLDPVMSSSSGYQLTKGDICDYLKTFLIPYCTLITPNLPETSMLLGYTVLSDIDSMKIAARQLAEYGCEYVLVKGGHREGEEEATDILYSRSTEEFHSFSSPFIFTWNAHGTGCTLSSAIASYLAKGMTMVEAVQAGKDYVFGALKNSHGLRIGKGRQGSMNHMYRQYEFL